MNTVSKPESLEQKLKRTYLAVEKVMKEGVAGSEFTPTRAAVLLAIESPQGTPVTQIGPAIGQDSRSLFRVIEFMIKNKWVVKKEDKEDTRVVRVCLTNLGKKKKELAREYHRNMGKQVVHKMSNKKISKLSELLDELLTNIEQRNFKR